MYLRYLCLFTYWCVQNIFCCVIFSVCLPSSCVPYAASFSGLSILDCPFDFPLRLFTHYLLIITLLPFFIEMLQYDWL